MNRVSQGYSQFSFDNAKRHGLPLPGARGGAPATKRGLGDGG
jgi:hypothetical protein